MAFVVPHFAFRVVLMFLSCCLGSSNFEGHLRFSSGFSLGALQRQIMGLGTRGQGKVAAHYNAAQTTALEESANAQVLKNRLNNARTHLQDAVLKIEDYTNRIEMGLHPVPHFKPEDADALDQKMTKPLKKAEESLLDMQEDLRTLKLLDASVRSSCNDVVARGLKCLGLAKAASGAIRNADNDGVMKQLNLLRDGVDFIGSLADKSTW